MRTLVQVNNSRVNKLIATLSDGTCAESAQEFTSRQTQTKVTILLDWCTPSPHSSSTQNVIWVCIHVCSNHFELKSEVLYSQYHSTFVIFIHCALLSHSIWIVSVSFSLFFRELSYSHMKFLVIYELYLLQRFLLFIHENQEKWANFDFFSDKKNNANR